MLALALAVFLLTIPWAQQPAPPHQAARKAAPKPRPCQKGTDPQTCERGWQLLDDAEAEAAGLREGGMRAYAQLQIARAYTVSDKKKTITLLDAAFAATLNMVGDGSRSRETQTLQGQILTSLAPLAPERVQELAPQAVPPARREAFQALLGYYEKNKRLDEAMATIDRLAGESDFPYAAASRIMTALPPEKAGERQQLFVTALHSFQTHPPARNAFFFGGDFLALVVDHWKEMPPALVREAIDEVLKQADTNADPNAKPVRVTMSYQGGSAAFSSMYEYQLFELLPVLRQIDPEYADSLLRDHQALAQQFDSYSQAGTPAITGIFFGNSYQRPSHFELKADPVAHPDEALEKVLALNDPEVQANFLLAYARQTLEKNPTTAKNFLDKLVSTVAPQIKSARDQARVFADAADFYLKLNNSMGAQKAIAAGNAAAEKLYGDDTDTTHPNPALKAYWPSTNAWIRLVRLAGRVSPDLSLELVKETRDEEIRPVLRIALAGAWIGAPLGPLTVIDKNGGWSQNRDPETRD